MGESEQQNHRMGAPMATQAKAWAIHTGVCQVCEMALKCWGRVCRKGHADSMPCISDTESEAAWRQALICRVLKGTRWWAWICSWKEKKESMPVCPLNAHRSPLPQPCLPPLLSQRSHRASLFCHGHRAACCWGGLIVLSESAVRPCGHGGNETRKWVIFFWWTKILIFLKWALFH